MLGGVVQVDQLRPVGKLDRRERERESTAAEELGTEVPPSEAGELLDDGRDVAVGEVEAAVGLGVVVPAFALVDAREPEWTVLTAWITVCVPGEAAVQDHANESARSARIARISSSALPARTRSIGRRSSRFGFAPSSHSRAASGS